MRAFEITDEKLITDLCGKFHFKKQTLLPIFKFDEDEEYLRNLNFAKLRDEVMQEQERLEKQMKEVKLKKLAKWKLLNV